MNHVGEEDKASWDKLLEIAKVDPFINDPRAILLANLAYNHLLYFIFKKIEGRIFMK